MIKSFMICTLYPIVAGDKIKKNAMGGACSAYGGEVRCVLDFVWET